MDEHAVPADERLTVYCAPGMWRLLGPDGKPVFEARPRMIYYHPLFGRWRDLPPGDRMSVDGIESIQVRWDGGWAVGITLAPQGLWRRLVRWEDTRHIARADEAARALSEVTGCPLRTEDDQLPPVRHVQRPAPSPQPLAPAEEPPAPSEALPTPSPADTMAAPPLIYTVDDAADVRLPLRLGSGVVLRRDEADRLVLLLSAESRASSLVLTLLGMGVLGVLLAVVLAIRGGSLGGNPLLGLLGFGALLIGVGLVGIWSLTRVYRSRRESIVFDRDAGEVILPPPAYGKEAVHVPLVAVHGVRISGQPLRTRSALAYRRMVSLMLDSGDEPLFEETRTAPLPPDPAVMPSLAALRRQADEKAGPSLARAGARVIAWYLGVLLVDE